MLPADYLDGCLAAGSVGDEAWQVPAAVQQGYAKAQHAAELRQPYEESVAAGKPPGADLLAAYMAYVKVEERSGDPGRVQVKGAAGWKQGLY